MNQVFSYEYFLELSLLELHHDSLPGVTEVRRKRALGASDIICEWSLPGQTWGETTLK